MQTLNETVRIVRPIKTHHDKRLAFLVSLEKSYNELGYSTKLNGRDNVLEVYEKGATIPKSQEEVLKEHEAAIIEKWIN